MISTMDPKGIQTYEQLYGAMMQSCMEKPSGFDSQEWDLVFKMDQWAYRLDLRFAREGETNKFTLVPMAEEEKALFCYWEEEATL